MAAIQTALENINAPMEKIEKRLTALHDAGVTTSNLNACCKKGTGNQ
jgi:hypothetical protein